MKLILMTDYSSGKIPPSLKLHIINNEEEVVAYLGLEGSENEIITKAKEIHKLLGKFLDSNNKLEKVFEFDKEMGWYVFKNDEDL